MAALKLVAGTLVLLGGLTMVGMRTTPSPAQAQSSSAKGPEAATAEAPKPGASRPAETHPEVELLRSDPASLQSRVDQLRGKLMKPANLPRGVDPNTPFNDAKDFLSDTHEIPIFIDRGAFKAQEREAVEDVPVRLPRMIGVPIGEALDRLAEQVGGVILLRPWEVLITTRQRARPEEWAAGPPELVPEVRVRFANQALDASLREVSLLTGISVVLDARVREQASKVMVSADLNGVPLPSAVRVLADMGGLRAVVLDGMLYVTSVPNAERLEKEQAQLRAARATRLTELRMEEQRESRPAGKESK